MAKWDVEVVQDFSCPQQEAQSRVDELLKEFQAKRAGLIKGIRWNADQTVATADGKGFDGEFSIDAGRVVARIRLGLAAKLFKGRVESEMAEALTKAFS